MKTKRALVTGGGSGIGLATAHRLNEDGYEVIISGRSKKRLDKAKFQNVVMDVTDETSVTSAFEQIGGIDILISNAGNALTAPLLKTPLKQWNDMLSVNLTGAFLCAKAAIPHMVEKGWGRFIVIASTSSVKAYPYTGAYASAKHGVLGLVKTLALELAKTGVTSNAICPGFTQTDILTRSIDNIVSKTGRSPEEALKALVKDNPMKRAIAPAEVAHAVSWLVDDRSGSTNGVALPIDGGELIS